MNISKQQYFYIISGLPNLSLQDGHLSFFAKTFLEDLRIKMDKKDFNLVCMLYYARDNENLLNILFNEKIITRLEGCFSIQELKKGMEGNLFLPDYMNAFIASFKEDRNLYDEATWEAKLTEVYFKTVTNTENDFLNKWMEFELNLKNLLLLMSNRKQVLPFPEIVIEANEISTLMKENPTADFSTQPSIDFVNEIVKIIESENLIQRESKIDALRWMKLEEMTFFNYFTVEAILSFIIKLMTIERWTILKQGPEKVFITPILDEFIEKIKIPVMDNS